MSQTSEGQTSPEAGVAISAGPLVAYTDANGKFTLAGVPLGNLKLTAQLGGFATQVVSVNTRPGQENTLDKTVIMQPEGAVIGDIVPLSIAEISGSYDPRLPYLRPFRVYNPANASKIRFSHIRAELENDSLPLANSQRHHAIQLPRSGRTTAICAICI